MLPPKFVVREAMIAQPRPHQSLTPGFLFPQVAGDACCFWSLFQHRWFTAFSRLSLTPALPRWEREYALPCLVKSCAGICQKIRVKQTVRLTVSLFQRERAGVRENHPTNPRF